MSETHFKFTELQLTKLKPCQKRTRYYDTQMPGLVLDLLPSGYKSFRVYKKLPGTSRPLSITLGEFLSLDLDSARKLARKVMADIADGINPNDMKRQFRAVTWSTFFRHPS